MPTERQPDVSVILVNWNAREMLRACLRSLKAESQDLAMEVIVVDNGSTDGSLEMLNAEWPGAVVVQPGGNVGYVRANNLGLAKATGRHVFFLNNDTVVERGGLIRLAGFLDARPDVGVCSGLILNPDGTDQGCARRMPSVWNGIFGRRSPLTRWWPSNPWSRRYMVTWQKQGDEPFEVEILSSAAILMRTAEARELGGMDEDFRLYWVDAELCSRVRRRGGKVYCVPAARIVHFEGQGGSTRTFRMRLRSLITFHHDAYLAYTKVGCYRWWHPAALLAGAALAIRASLLAVVQLMRPDRATSSGMTTSPYRRNTA